MPHFSCRLLLRKSHLWHHFNYLAERPERKTIHSGGWFLLLRPPFFWGTHKYIMVALGDLPFKMHWLVIYNDSCRFYGHFPEISQNHHHLAIQLYTVMGMKLPSLLITYYSDQPVIFCLSTIPSGKGAQQKTGVKEAPCPARAIEVSITSKPATGQHAENVGQQVSWMHTYIP